MHYDALANKKLSFLGGGIIAGVFIERLLKTGVTTPENILATDIRPERLEELKQQFGVQVSGNNSDGASFGDILFIAVPPNAVKSVLSEIRLTVRVDQLLVSLAAAIPTSWMESVLDKPIPILRIIPNTPSLIGQGMNPYCLGRQVTAEHLPMIEELLSVLGKTMRIEERLMNVATALTAVGPSYIFPILKALKEAAMSKGFSESDAQFAAAQTVLGAAQLVLETGKDPDTLKLMIGMRTLNEEEASKIFTAAVNAAFEKISDSEKKLSE